MSRFRNIDKKLLYERSEIAVLKGMLVRVFLRNVREYQGWCPTWGRHFYYQSIKRNASECSFAIDRYYVFMGILNVNYTDVSF